MAGKFTPFLTSRSPGGSEILDRNLLDIKGAIDALADLVDRINRSLIVNGGSTGLGGPGIVWTDSSGDLHVDTLLSITGGLHEITLKHPGYLAIYGVTGTDYEGVWLYSNGPTASPKLYRFQAVASGTGTTHPLTLEFPDVYITNLFGAGAIGSRGANSTPNGKLYTDPLLNIDDVAHEFQALGTSASFAAYKVTGTNYERAHFIADANGFQLVSEQGGSGSRRPLRINFTDIYADNLGAGGIVYADSGSTPAGKLALVSIGTGLSFVAGTLSATGGGGTVTAVTGSAPIASSGGTTPNITLNTNGVTDTFLRQGGALSVIGRSANSTGNVADISASAGTGFPLRESGSTIGFGAIAESAVTNLVTDLAGKVPTTRQINTSAPLTGGGDLSADRFINVSDFVASGASHARGTVPDPGVTPGATKFLREDATWAVPPDTGITQLTGDVTAGPGSGSQAATLASVGPGAGTYGGSGVASITLDAKGRVTGLSTDSYAKQREFVLTYAFTATADPSFGAAAVELPGGYSQALNAIGWRYLAGSNRSTVILQWNVITMTLGAGTPGGKGFTFNVLRNGTLIPSATSGVLTASGSSTTGVISFTPGGGDFYSLQLDSNGVVVAGTVLTFTTTVILAAVP